jgi:hypothetical protein
MMVYSKVKYGATLQISEVYLGSMCTTVQLYSLAETTQPPPTLAFGHNYEGAIGQPGYTTSLCNPLVKGSG